MPVNQPPISDDPIVATWQLEVARYINELEEQLRDLQSRVSTLEQRSNP